MDTFFSDYFWFLMIIPCCVFLMSLVVGILMLVKYKKTKERKFLVLGIILTFVIPGIFFLIACGLVIWRVFIPTTITYMPPPDPGISYMPETN